MINTKNAELHNSLYRIYARHSKVAANHRLSIKLIKRCLRDSLRQEGVAIPCEVSVMITNDEAIRKINREYRSIDAATDVLSFPMHDFIPGKFPNQFPGKHEPPAAEADAGIGSGRGMQANTDSGLYSISVSYTSSEASASSGFVSDILLLGDIVISAERLYEQAQSFGHSIERETAYLTVHSVLHLLGYDHADEAEDKRKMRLREERIVGELGVSEE